MISTRCIFIAEQLIFIVKLQSPAALLSVVGLFYIFGMVSEKKTGITVLLIRVCSLHAGLRPTGLPFPTCQLSGA